MKKLLYIPAFLTLFLLINVSPTFSQEQYVKVAGKIYQASDSTPMVANVRYEKLPYRGHSGDFTSSTDGSYEFWLQLESDYYIALAREGFEESYDTVTVVDATESGVMTQDYYLKPIEEENFVLHDLIFARGSDVIQESSYTELDEFVTWLKAHPSLVVQLEGHTDVAGNPEANMRLSQSRVEAVKVYIEKKGIKDDRVRTKAFGGTHPLSEERTPEAVRANRRVEVRVIAR